ncbi:MAG: FUSC family protein [Ktedonobacteraceae bacterium]
MGFRLTRILYHVFDGHSPHHIKAFLQKIADYAIQLPQDHNEQVSQAVRDALLQAYSTVTDSNLRSRQGKIFFGLLEEAKRIRLSLIVLSRTRRYVAEAMPEQADGVQYLDQLLHSTAATLQDIAHDLRATPRFFRITQPHEDIKDALTALRKQDVPPQAKDLLRGTLAYADALRDQLHIAKKLAKSWRYRQQNAEVNVPVPRQARLRLRDARTTLRANLTLRSSAFRHAIRLGVALALATAISHLFLTSEERGYWIVLTALLVLKPDFIATFARGVARTLGTMLGAVLTTLVVSLLVPNNTVLVILVGIMAYLAFSVLFANYAIFSAFITTETVLLLTFVIPQPLMTTAYRAIDTTIGGILALLIYALWPTWERSRVMPNIARRIEAIREYFVEAMKAYTQAGAYDTLALHNRLMEARLARSNAEASVERSLQEPEPHRIDANLAYGLLGAAERIIQRVLTLEAYLIDNPGQHACPEITLFAKYVDDALHLLATSVQNEQPVSALPDLERALKTLKHAEKSSNRSSQQGCADLSIVITEAKGIIRNIHIMKSLLSTNTESKPGTTQTLPQNSP